MNTNVITSFKMAKINDKDMDFFYKYDNIYSMVPEYLLLDNQRKKIYYIKKNILIKWFKQHKGVENVVRLNVIADELNFSKIGNCVGMRNIITYLVDIEKFPIVSCSKGYYYGINAEDFEQNISTEQNRIKGIQRRIYALEHIRNKIILGGEI